MNISFDYYLLTQPTQQYPSWVKSERYFNCENFSRFLSLFRKK